MKTMVEIFKGLADETRVEMVRLLMGKSLCVCDIMEAFHLTQPAISHHLKILKQAGLIQDHKEGKWVFYQLRPEGFAYLREFCQEYEQLGGESRRCEPRSCHKL